MMDFKEDLATNKHEFSRKRFKEFRVLSCLFVAKFLSGRA
jgi:hypothetical protein